MNNYSQFIDPNLLRNAIAEVPPLISEADLHVAQQSLVLLTSTARYQSKALVDTYRIILPEVLNLLRSPLLQGTALNCMLELFQALVRAQLPNLGYRQLLDSLRSIIDLQNNQQLHKQVSIFFLRKRRRQDPKHVFLFFRLSIPLQSVLLH